jgi:AraC family transcriptional activator of mtrCDE
MDALTRLVHLARPQASLELRCQLHGSFAVPADARPNAVPFHLALGGRCVIDVANGSSLVLEAGDLVMFPKGGAHCMRDVERSTVKRTPLQLSHDGMLPLEHNAGAGRSEPDVDLLCGRFDYDKGPAALLLRNLPDPLHVSLAETPSAPALQALVTLMRGEAERRQPGALAIVTALSHALFTIALRSYGQQHPDMPNMLTLLSDARLASSVQALLAEPGRDWTIADLGEKAAMSRATYARRFRECAGMTVLEFLTQVRMTLAANLLTQTQRSAADIGMEVGYQSEAAFGKAFQQSMGMTPGRYRKQERSEALSEAHA